jgi:hypothetical protein
MDIVDLQRVGMDIFLQSKCESIFGIIVDFQRIQINKLTVQMQINMGNISIFDKLKRKIIQVRNMK